MHRKGWGTCRSPKSYSLSLDCLPCFVLFAMANKISMSQWALPKVMSQRYILSQRYIPNNATMKKRTVCILRPVLAFSWAPVITLWNLHKSCQNKRFKRTLQSMFQTALVLMSIGCWCIIVLTTVTLQLCKHGLDSILDRNSTKQSRIISLEIMKMKCYNFFNMSTKLTPLRADEMYPRKADEL